jgi:DNA-binding response OmpR family regulator
VADRTAQPRVLVVDDDRTMRDAVVRALDAAGHVTAACGSVDRAVELARDLRSDLVVLEMVLGGRVVGLELAGRLRRQADVPLVFATRHADVEDRLAALARNAGQVVPKARLLDVVWGPDAVDVNLVEVHVSGLRRRLGPGAAGMIRTVRGVGYMLDDDDTVDPHGPRPT